MSTEIVIIHLGEGGGGTRAVWGAGRRNSYMHQGRINRVTWKALHPNEDGFPLESGSSPGFLLMSSQGLFPRHRRHVSLVTSRQIGRRSQRAVKLEQRPGQSSLKCFKTVFRSEIVRFCWRIRRNQRFINLNYRSQQFHLRAQTWAVGLNTWPDAQIHTFLFLSFFLWSCFVSIMQLN